MIPTPNWRHVEPPLRTAWVAIHLLVLGYGIAICADNPEGWLLGAPLLVEVAISPWAFQGGPQLPPRLLLIPAIAYAAAAALLTETQLLPAEPILRFATSFIGFWVILWGTGWLVIGPMTTGLALSIARSARRRRWVWRTVQRWVGAAGRGDAPNGDIQSKRGLRTRAEQGDAGAQNVLGFMYSHGQGVPQDDHEAVRWYQLAAEQGHAAAQFNLGLKHINGKGTPQNDSAAVHWWRLAAEQGHAVAQNNLGSMYANGEGTVQDDREAAHWYQLAANQGLADAQKNLEIMYANNRPKRVGDERELGTSSSSAHRRGRGR